MFPPSHSASSLLILLFLNALSPSLFPKNLMFLIFSAFFSNLPDLDVFWSKTLNAHHDSILHTPIFWAAITLIGMIISSAFNISSGIVLLLGIQAVFHLLFDSITTRSAGIFWLFPFSKKEFSLFPLEQSVGDFNPRKLSNYAIILKHYTKNKFLVVFEIFILFIGILSLYFFI